MRNVDAERDSCYTVTVPAAGRHYKAIPECVRSLPDIHDAINANGAPVYDVRKDPAICRREMPWQRAVERMSFFDAYPLFSEYRKNRIKP